MGVGGRRALRQIGKACQFDRGPGTLPRVAKTVKKASRGVVRGRSVSAPVAADRPETTGEIERRGSVETGWRADKTVVRLTAKLLALHQAAAIRETDAIVEKGKLLDAVRARLSHGQWLRWADEAVPYSQRTITNYVGLARFAATEREEYDRFKDLGSTKLYELANLAANRRRRFHTTAPIAIPGTAHKKTLTLMTHEELRAVIGGPQLTASPNDPPIAKVLQTFRHRTAAIAALVETLKRRRSEVSAREAKAIHAEVVELAHAVASAFALTTAPRLPR
jgi:hypothetical protein